MNNHEKARREPQIFQLMDGAVRAWIEQGAIHLIAIDSPHRDPVELTAKMAKELAGKLLEFSDGLDD